MHDSEYGAAWLELSKTFQTLVTPYFRIFAGSSTQQVIPADSGNLVQNLHRLFGLACARGIMAIDKPAFNAALIVDHFCDRAKSTTFRGMFVQMRAEDLRNLCRQTSAARSRTCHSGGLKQRQIKPAARNPDLLQL